MHPQSSKPLANGMGLTAFKLEGLQKTVVKYGITNGPKRSRTSKKEHEVRGYVDQGLKAIVPLPQFIQPSKAFLYRTKLAIPISKGSVRNKNSNRKT